MPATEETYRSQRTLHLVFAVSSIAMTLSIIWMIMADHLRPWKEVQREFHKIEKSKLEAQEQEKLADQERRYKAEIDAIDAKIKEAQDLSYERAADIRAVEKEIKTLGGDFERIDTAKRFMKAELDSQRSLYDGMIERGEERQARAYIASTISPSEERLMKLSREFEVADAALKSAEARLAALRGNIDDLVKERESRTREADRVRRVIEQKDAQYFGVSAFLRNLPGVDLVPPTKIQQISLPDLKINYNFKEVPRYDRCTTCHLGIDRIGYEKDAEGNPMPGVFASHPHLTDGATTLDPKGNVIPAGLYLDANGPHPINSFGCTICHGGQGSGTDFTYSSHEPNDLHQKEEWEEKKHWHKMHHWDEPMLPRRFMESSCLKCHHQVADVPQAEKLQAGYQRIVQYGCTGCHTIGGEGSIGPDLTNERAVGPNLAHVGSKASKEWMLKWIKNPHAFRPDSRMPRFYGVTNNNAPRDWPKSHAEIHAITHYLFAKSTPPSGFVDPPSKNDPQHGKELFLQKGCLACHAHKPYAMADLQLQDRKEANPNYKPDASATFHPGAFPASVQQYAAANYGPNLANIAAKFQSHEQGYKWLANWVKAPELYHPNSLMPNLQLSLEDAADIAAWILSIPGEWPVSVDVPSLESEDVRQGLEELVTLYVTKGGYSRDGKSTAVALSEVEEFVKTKLSTDDKLMFVGEKTISRLGCFGCHTIPGYENAKPIGTPLNGWGIKSPAKLDYAHILEYLEDQPLGENGERDGTDAYYQDQLAEATRAGFLYQKLHRPRSYDFKKTNEDLKTWDERLRMPQFAWANDPRAVEEIMTFVLGLTGEKIDARYLPDSHYTPRQNALAQGAKILNRYNCSGCHVLEMPKYTVEAGTKFDEAFVNFPSNLNASYTSRGLDFLQTFYPSLSFDENVKVTPDSVKAALGLAPASDAARREAATLAKALGLVPPDNAAVVVEGMPIGVFENELTVQLWKPVTICGYTFNTGDTLTLDQTKIKKTDPVGGDFAWLFSTHQAEQTGAEFSPLWNRLPPPLLREGSKVQTPWLTGFLKDPYAIRPAANLRMPRFHFAHHANAGEGEPAGLANYFAAVDGAEFPYQSIPERTQAYLAEVEGKHPDYLGAGWMMMTAKTSPCLSCHAIGQFKPTGGATVINGPDLRQVANRFRPEFLKEWLAKPSRLLPYTAMPQNIAPRGPTQMPVAKSFENMPLDQVTLLRDTLLNYVNAVEQQLAAGGETKPQGAADPAASAKPTGGTE